MVTAALIATSPRASASATPITGSGSVRIAGSDRYGTAVAMSKKVYAPPNDVYLASGEDFPDALAAGPVAAFGGPILLVGRTALPEVTKGEIQRLQPGTVTLVGGHGAISESIEQAVAKAVPNAAIVRVGGANRFDTAALLAEQMAQVQLWERMVLVSGAAFPDALAAGPLAAGIRGPLLLTAKDELPQETRRVLELVKPRDIWLVGGPGVIGDSVIAELRLLLPEAGINRVWGRDRYATAANLAGSFGPARLQSAFLASGTNFPDALVAVPVASRQPTNGDFGGAPILFTRATCMPTPTASHLALARPILRVVVGGVGVAYNGDRRC
jgi:putative cell wall-binding protein